MAFLCRSLRFVQLLLVFSHFFFKKYLVFLPSFHWGFSATLMSSPFRGSHTTPCNPFSQGFAQATLNSLLQGLCISPMQSLYRGSHVSTFHWVFCTTSIQTAFHRIMKGDFSVQIRKFHSTSSKNYFSQFDPFPQPMGVEGWRTLHFSVCLYISLNF